MWGSGGSRGLGRFGRVRGDREVGRCANVEEMGGIGGFGAEIVKMEFKF